MPQQLSPTPQVRANPPVRDRGDACPGALRLHRADDGFLARARIPAGVLTAHQALALAAAAERLGDARLDITSRGNLQLRGLAEDGGRELSTVLEESGLLPSPRHERVRNIVASPLSGLDGGSVGPRGESPQLPDGDSLVHAWARRLDALLCASERARALSGRFLFALDDGRGDVAALGADVILIARPGGHALLRAGHAESAVRVPGQAAPRAALLAAESFLTAADESASRAWRVAELPGGAEPFARTLPGLLAEAGIPAREVPAPGAPSREAHGGPVPYGDPPAPGLVHGPSGRCALSVLAPLGRLTAEQWRRVADAAERYGSGELRVTPWRGVLVPGLDPACAPGALRELEAAGLVTDADSPWTGVGACTGLPGCAKSLRDVRADAERHLAAGHGGLPVHWSGCERRCGHPRGEWVDVVATPEGYRVSVRGQSVRESARGEAEADTAEAPVPRDLAGAVAAARTRNRDGEGEGESHEGGSRDGESQNDESHDRDGTAARAGEDGAAVTR
ncbi:precorrin-3B synthase [Streptomyces sp. ODS28]|uniref:precorrin-3B synthase n=1 Tax=Streptomyces sp. ODS28 TaxID=3136688 RepID=UPI0031F1B3D8